MFPFESSTDCSVKLVGQLLIEHFKNTVKVYLGLPHKLLMNAR